MQEAARSTDRLDTFAIFLNWMISTHMLNLQMVKGQKIFIFRCRQFTMVLSRILDFIASFAQGKQINQCASMGAKSVKETVLP